MPKSVIDPANDNNFIKSIIVAVVRVWHQENTPFALLSACLVLVLFSHVHCYASAPHACRALFVYCTAQLANLLGMRYGQHKVTHITPLHQTN